MMEAWRRYAGELPVKELFLIEAKEAVRGAKDTEKTNQTEIHK